MLGRIVRPNSTSITIHLSIILGIAILMWAMFATQFLLNIPTASAAGNLAPAKSEALVNGVFPQNNITGWNPLECVAKGIGSDSCFKVDGGVEAQDAWYAEGCLNTGDCSGGLYFASGHPPKSDSGLVVTGNNPWIYDDTKVDDEWGGMQYIYAENYDIESYEGAYTKMTPNGGNSTQKYYWIVLPDQAYSNGFGDTYIATFENFAEPVYFIVFDTHACSDQGEDYCGKASADPDGVQIGREFFGAFTQNAGSPTTAAEIAGKLTSLCRINGSGEVTASHDASNATSATSGGTSTSSSSTSSSSSSSEPPSGDQITWIGDSYSCGALSIIKGKFPGISFGGSECDSNSYIMSNKGVSDRYGGGSDNPPALTILKRVADAGELKPYLVMAVGTNAGWDDNEVNELKNIISSHSDTKVILVNAKARAHLMSDDNGTNDRLKALVDSEDNFYLADWAAAYDDSYFANNSTHPDANGGYEKWVEVIANALSNTNNCTTYEGDYPEYLQSADPWGPMSYGPGCTFAGCACGATSMAMLTTYVTGQDVLPTDVADLLGSSYYWATGGAGATELDKKVCEKYGCEAEAVSWSGYDDAISKMKQYLSEGYSIHLSGAGSYPFSDGGHYIGIFALTSGDNVMTANSAFGGNAEMNLSDLVHAGLHYEFTIIKGSGSSNGSCDAICDAEPTTALDGGLTEEQAQKIADYYNSDAVSAGGLPMGTKENCVSFSAWFVSYLTNVTDATNPTRGDGLDVANNLVADYGINGGDTPQVWSVFSNPTGTPVNGSSNHTGVIVGIEDGQAITIEAAWGGWAGQSDGLARVWKYAMPESGMYYAYFNDHLESSKLSEIIGGS